MIADLAETEALLLLRKPGWKVGDELRIDLYVELDVTRPRNVTGRVVRIEPLPDERTSLWNHPGRRRVHRGDCAEPGGDRAH